MGSHAKEFAVFFKDRLGKPYKQYSVVKNRKVLAEMHGKRFGLLHSVDYSHVAQVNKLQKT